MKKNTAFSITLLACVATLFITATSFKTTRPALRVHAVTLYPAPDSADIAGTRNTILKLINEHRASLKLPALQLLDELNTEAQQHSDKMASGSVGFGHTGFGDRYNRISKKVKGVNGIAENVAYGDITTEEIVDGWLNSLGHKKNIEGDFNYTGIGIGQRKDGVYFYTQIFLKKK
jgi:uncharacterized protein YkwD